VEKSVVERDRNGTFAVVAGLAFLIFIAKNQ